MTTVSVVMSTYNRGHFLPLALRSALDQEGVDHEVVVVNNGSTDLTHAVLERVRDDRLRVVRNVTSLGPIGGRNSGLAVARGEWVAIHDDDDLWAPDKLVRQIQAANEQARPWAYSGCVYIDGHGQLLGGRPPVSPDELVEQLSQRYAVRGGISNAVWRREALDDDGLLDPELPMTADWDLALRLVRYGKPAVADRPLLAYRQHGSNMSQRAARMQSEFDRLETKHAAFLGGNAIERGEQFRFIASESLRAGARSAAARAYWQGWRAGDKGCALRAPALLAPAALHPLLRRHFLSDARWMDGARSWIEAYAVPAELQDLN